MSAASGAAGGGAAVLDALRAATVTPESVVVAILCKVIDGYDVGGAPTAFERRLTAYALGGVDVLPTGSFTQLIAEASAGMAGVAEDHGVERDVKQYVKAILRSPHGLGRLFQGLSTFSDGSSIQHKTSPISVFCRKLLLHWQAATYRQQDALWLRVRGYLLPHSAYIEGLPDCETDSEMLEEDEEEYEEEEDVEHEAMPSPIQGSYGGYTAGGSVGGAAAAAAVHKDPMYMGGGAGAPPAAATGGFFMPLPSGVADPTAVEGIMSHASRVDALDANVVDLPPERPLGPTAREILQKLAVGSMPPAVAANADRLRPALDTSNTTLGLEGLAAFHFHVDTGNRQRAMDACLRYFDACVAAQPDPRAAAAGPGAAAGAAAAAVAAPGGAASGGAGTSTSNTGAKDGMKAACAWALVHLAYMHTQFEDYTAARRCVDEAVRAGLSLSEKETLVTCGYLTVVLCLREGRVDEAIEELLYAFRVGVTVPDGQALGQLYAALAHLRLWFPTLLSKHADQFAMFLPNLHNMEAGSKHQVRAGMTGGVIGATLPGEQPACLSTVLPVFQQEKSTDDAELQSVLCMPQAGGTTWGDDGRGGSGRGSSAVGAWLALRAAWLQLPNVPKRPAAPGAPPHLAAGSGVGVLFGPALDQGVGVGDAFIAAGGGTLTLLKAQLLENLGMYDMALAELRRGLAARDTAGYTAHNRALAMQLVLALLHTRGDFRAAVPELAALVAATPDPSRHVPLQQLALYTVAYARLARGRPTAALELIDRALVLCDGGLPTPDAPVALHPHLHTLRVACLTHTAVRRYDEALQTALTQLDAARKSCCTKWVVVFSKLVAQVHTLCGTHGMTSNYITNAVRLCDEAVLPGEKAELLLLVAAQYLRDGDAAGAKRVVLQVCGGLRGALTAAGRHRLRMLAAQVLITMEVGGRAGDGEASMAEGDAGDDGEGSCDGAWMLEDDTPKEVLFPTPEGRFVAVASKADAVGLALQYLAPAHAQLHVEDAFHLHTLSAEVLSIAASCGLASPADRDAAAQRAMHALQELVEANAAPTPPRPDMNALIGELGVR